MLEGLAIAAAIGVVIISVVGNSLIVALLIKQHLEERRAKRSKLETQALLRGIPSVKRKKK